MATNKRKESAALFELIGKSTLKVPKNASALKIPEWWSSKTNPPSAPTKSPAITSDENLDAVAATVVDATPAPAAAQHRLFEPPPADVKSGVSPSIRPPASGNGSGVRAAVITESKPVELVVPVVAKSERANPVRIFAPQTMSQSAIPLRRGGGESYRHNGRIPLWALVMGVVVLVLVVVTVVAAIYAWSKPRKGVPTHAAVPSVSTVQPGNVLLPPSAQVQVPVQAPPVSSDTPEAATKGTVYGPGVIQRSPDLYYVIITQTPTASVAQKDADFLADHGIDVSIETSTGPGGKGFWYRLVSVQGYPTLVTANPFRKKIVLIGHLHDDFKKGKPMWDDAFLARVKAPAK